MAGVFSGSNGSTVLRFVNSSDVIMAKLYQHKVTRLQTVIHLLPAALVQVRATATSSHGSIDDVYLRLIKDGVSYGTPSPHAILIFVGILDSAVTCNKDDRLSLCTCNVVDGQLHIAHHGLQRVQRRVVTGHQALCCRPGIHHRPKTTGMYLVKEEMIVRLPRTISIQFLS